MEAKVAATTAPTIQIVTVRAHPTCLGYHHVWLTIIAKPIVA